jgi:hypothetical protein
MVVAIEAGGLTTLLLSFRTSWVVVVVVDLEFSLLHADKFMI